MVKVQIPATTANFGPAFDAVGMALQLYNTVEMQEIPNGLVIEVEGKGTESIARNENNLIYKAAKEVFARVGYQPTGLWIKAENNIPVTSGLGSSAAAIVGGMTAANQLAGGKLTEQQLLDMAAVWEGHPDNAAAAVLGGFVVAVLDQGHVEYVQFEPPENLKVVVAIPKFPMSTKAARSLLPQNVAFQDAVFNVGRTALLVAGLAKGNLDTLAAGTQDRLHQQYRSAKIPGMSEVLAAVQKAGAKGVALSGAGPTLIAFTSGKEKEISQAMQKAWEENGVSAEILILQPDGSGTKVGNFN